MSQSLSSRSKAVTNTLLVAPTFSEAAEEAWATVIESTDPSEADVLAVTYDGPGQALDRWGRSVGELPPKFGILAVGDDSRVTAAELLEDRPEIESSSQVAVDAVSNPGDLTGLGVRVSEYIGEWAQQRQGGGPENLVVDFDNVSTLLQYADVSEAYRFLHIFTGRLEAVDAEGIFRLDRGAHDEETIASIESLFDRVVEIEESGQHSIRSR